MDSVREHRSGKSHQFILIFKGISPEQVPSYRSVLSGFPATVIELKDEGFDITSYLQAVSATNYSRYCFLNSFSVVLDHDWLRKLDDPVEAGEVQLTGATGSWESHYSSSMWAAGAAVRHKPVGPSTIFSGAITLWRLRRTYPPFPNPHVRTNAFVVGRDTLQSRGVQVITKADAERFESGKSSLSRQVLADGGRVAVVGRDGVLYPPERFRRSHTFRIGSQENLLVADNRTEQYASATAERRAELEKLAWGESRSES
jgi:hypothetical protein